MKKHLSLITWILGFQCIGFAIGMASKSNLDAWYLTINKSTLTPPDFVFPIVWTLLYIILSFCGYLIFKEKSKSIRWIFCIAMILNWAWSPIFFNAHLVNLAFFVIVMLLLLNLTLMKQCYKKIKAVTYLLMPYVCWLSFAAYLNFFIVLHN
jgi:translocator protein